GVHPPVSSVKWLSFHVYLSGSMDLFLTRYFAPRLERACAARNIRRFFFIRYLDRGLHLRLRFMLGKIAGPFLIEKWLDEALREFSDSQATAVSYNIEQHEYHREKHYFGETIRSVYAELLNEQTSWLALGVLCVYEGRQRHLAVLLIACLR